MTDEQGAEYIKSGEARALLGVTYKRMAEILAAGENGQAGGLTWWYRGVNRQIKWVKRADVEALSRELHAFVPGKSKASSAA